MLAAGALGAAHPADAGPWPRPPGETFLSFGALAGSAASETQVWAERGLGAGWTLALDAAADRAGGGRAMVLAFRTLTGADARLRLAALAGAGGTMLPDGAVRPALRTGMTAGTGWGGRRPGWAQLDLAAEWRGDAVAWKADATLGLRVAPRWRAMVELQGEAGPAATLHLAPAAVFALREGLDLVAGARFGLAGDPGASVRLSAWLRF